MTTITRRRFLQTASAATLAVAGGLPQIVRAAQPTVTLRCSSSMPADQNAAHAGDDRRVCRALLDRRR